LPVEPDPQPGQDPKGHVVGDQPLGVAEGGPGDAEETDPNDGDVQASQRRLQGRGRDQPGRRPQEGDVGPDGQCAQEHGKNGQWLIPPQESQQALQQGKSP